ncbi:MAG: YIP1 family protein [Acidobacteriota bacterium]
MSEVQSPAAGPAGLSQWQRVANIFTAPSKTFQDIERGHRSWWLPFVLLSIVSYLFFAAVDQRIGIQQAVENQIRLSPKAQERLDELSPEQRQTQTRISTYITEGVFIGSPALMLAGAALLSLGLMGTVNFAFGGRAKFGSIFAVWIYAWLPSAIKTLLGVATIYAGMAPEAFNLKNFAPTNIAAFLDPGATNKALYSICTSLDIVTIWTLVLLSIGAATVAGIKRNSGYMAVFGWWTLFVLIGAGWAVVFS